jgi:transcriptional regulator with XRE-family HTH domain
VKHVTTGDDKGSRPAAVAEHFGLRVRALRQQRRWTLEDLAAECDLSRSRLSEIERGESEPTLTVAHRISAALGVLLGELVSPPAPEERMLVFRGDDPEHEYRREDGFLVRAHSPIADRDFLLFSVQLAAGRKREYAPNAPGSREAIAVTTGAVRISAGDESVVLHAGDATYYRSDRRGVFENIGEGEALIYVVTAFRRDDT